MHEIFIQYQSKENLIEIHMLNALTKFWHTSCAKAYSEGNLRLHGIPVSTALLLWQTS